MAFDGFTIKRITTEYNELLNFGKISKIIQPNNNDLVFVIKKDKETFNLFVSANPSMAYTYLMPEKCEAPKNVLNFCMVLRKHILNGRILKVYQTGNERIINILIEHLDEMGDKSQKKLIFELMGKYSNIILCDNDDVIIDSIKRVNGSKSSMRVVLPKMKYFFPSDLSKIDPYGENAEDEFNKLISSKEALSLNISGLLINGFEGVSKAFSKEVLKRAKIPLDAKVNDINENDHDRLKASFFKCCTSVCENNNYCFYQKNSILSEYTLFKYESIDDSFFLREDRLANGLYEFYKDKHNIEILNQRSRDIMNILNTVISKNNKKLIEWDKELKDCEDKEEKKKYGELLKAYSHQIKQGKVTEVLDYYTGQNISIPMDESKSVIENSNRYFADYAKKKRRESKLRELMVEAQKECEYLEEVLLYVSISENSSDLDQIREELFEKGYIKKYADRKNRSKTSSIKHYVYDDNYHIYVGKNNIQNEEVTFKIASGNDWWFHVKKAAGSHVIVRSEKDNAAKEWDMPDEVFEICAALAAINSSLKNLDKVQVDYTRKKHLKKPAEGNKGNVIYHTYYSMVAKSDISRFELTSINS